MKEFKNLHNLIHRVMSLDITNLVCCIALSVLIGYSLNLQGGGRGTDRLRVMSSRLMNVVDIGSSLNSQMRGHGYVMNVADIE